MHHMSMVNSMGDVTGGVKAREVKRGFGNLIISQTAAYGCRLLFKQWKKAV